MDLRLDLEDVSFVKTLIQGCNVECGTLLGELDLPGDCLEHGGSYRVSFADYVRILRHLVEVSGDETCTGSARRILVGTTPFLLGGVSKNTTLREAFQRLADGYNFAHGGSYNRVQASSNRLIYIVDDTDFPYSHADFSRDRHPFIESILVSLHGLFGRLAGQPLADRVLRVTTRRPADDPRGSFLKFWHAPVQRGAEYYSIQYDGRIADWPVQPIDEAAYLSIFDAATGLFVDDTEAASGGDYWTRRTGQLITSGAAIQSEAVAASLGLSPATLRRRLAGEGANFRSLRAGALNARARRLLALGEPAHKVAAALGFADLRSFSRAFKGWNRVTPAAFQAGPGTNQE